MFLLQWTGKRLVGKVVENQVNKAFEKLPIPKLNTEIIKT